jgi:hypothetical protein
MVQAWNQYESVDQVLDIVDPTLEGKYSKEKALRVITIALLCTQGALALRPAMSQVATMLTYNSNISVHPTQPTFIDGVAARPTNSSTTSNSETLASASSHGSITMSPLPC